MAKCDICGETILSEGTCCTCCDRALDIGLAILRNRKRTLELHIVDSAENITPEQEKELNKLMS